MYRRRTKRATKQTRISRQILLISQITSRLRRWGTGVARVEALRWWRCRSHGNKSNPRRAVKCNQFSMFESMFKLMAQIKKSIFEINCTEISVGLQSWSHRSIRPLQQQQKAIWIYRSLWLVLWLITTFFLYIYRSLVMEDKWSTDETIGWTVYWNGLNATENATHYSRTALASESSGRATGHRSREEDLIFSNSYHLLNAFHNKQEKQSHSKLLFQTLQSSAVESRIKLNVF